MLKNILQSVDHSNMFMKKYVSPLIRTVNTHEVLLKKLKDMFPKHEEAMKNIMREMEELNTVWSQEEEKTLQMNKLLSSLFEEVTDQQERAKELGEVVGKVTAET